MTVPADALAPVLGQKEAQCWLKSQTYFHQSLYGNLILRKFIGSGALPTKEISIKFQILLENICSYLFFHQSDHKEIYYIPRQECTKFICDLISFV